MAAGPGPERGKSYLYLGDIGDNNEARAEIVVYRVPEPALTDTRKLTKTRPGTTEQRKRSGCATQTVRTMPKRYSFIPSAVTSTSLRKS